MSNVLRINKDAKLNVKVRGMNGDNVTSAVNEKEQMQLQIHNAYERGFGEGYKKAADEFEKKYEDMLRNRYEELNNFLKSVDEKILSYDDTFNNVVVELAFVVAEKIIGESIKGNSIVNNTLNESMKKVLGANNVIIKMNNDDLKKLNSESKSLLNDASFSKVKFEADDTIESGGCLIETDIGNVDGRISTQLKELKKILDQKVLMNDTTDGD